MSEIELIMLEETSNCTFYTIQFVGENESEYKKFYDRFKGDLEYNADFERILNVLNMMLDRGAFERLFRPEGKMSDRVCALPVLKSKLRLYCLRLSDKILILGNGGVKKTQRYEEDDELRGYVVTLQKFDRLIKEGQRDGSIVVTESKIETNKSLEI